jgi:ABC-type branched-subunit amino acid transport system permease subunit
LFLWVPIAALVLFGLRRSGFGRLLCAIGDNLRACQLAGAHVWRVLLVGYALCGLLAAIAGIVLVGNTNSADLGLADTYLLPSIASVIIGGTSIFGGRGGYEGIIIGALILTVSNGLLALVDSPEPIKQILLRCSYHSVGGSLYASDRLRVSGCRSRFRRRYRKSLKGRRLGAVAVSALINLANDGNGTPIKSVHRRREGRCRLQST